MHLSITLELTCTKCFKKVSALYAKSCWSYSHTKWQHQKDQDTQQCVMRPKKPWAHANGSEFTKLRFSRIHRSVTFYLKITKFAVELPAYKGRLDSKIEVNCARRFRDTRDQSFSFCSSFFFLLLASSSFRTNHKIGSNSQVRTLILLKFSPLVGYQEVNVRMNFGQNPYKLLKVIIDHLRKTRTIFRHAYRVNC